jgi:hypothetical protein
MVSFSILAQTTDHFTIELRSKLGTSSIKWTAKGIPSPEADSRSIWERFNLGQRIFSIATLLALIGLTADLIGIGTFIWDHFFKTA